MPKNERTWVSMEFAFLSSTMHEVAIFECWSKEEEDIVYDNCVRRTNITKVKRHTKQPFFFGVVHALYTMNDHPEFYKHRGVTKNIYEGR